ncbi:hypothetical protein VV02_19615 [Luteipulveratus mongoliensis]|uniref:Uncharacterized protein n=1 Tax=Luteipulveratus mongoliensis TaxID=571913 RepID=A0A0K1JQX3_9MICO|nr:hypothetical protein VV02_19615 [Luteipulveratus mongoliensis]
MSDVLGAGLIAQIEADAAAKAERSAAFWYVTAGLAMLLLAALVRALERSPAGIPRYLSVAFAALGAWGVVLMPASGFWAFFVLAAIAWRSARPR